MCTQVPNNFISRLDLIPDVDTQKLRITVQGNQPALGLPVSVAAMQDGKQVCSVESKIILPGKHLIMRARESCPGRPGMLLSWNASAADRPCCTTTEWSPQHFWFTFCSGATQLHQEDLFWDVSCL